MAADGKDEDEVLWLEGCGRLWAGRAVGLVPNGTGPLLLLILLLLAPKIAALPQLGP